MKTCVTCKETKETSDFPLIGKGGYRRTQCKDCHNAVQRDRYARNSFERRMRVVKFYNRDRHSIVAQVFQHYGNECADCQEADIDVLTIDHINNDGGKRRQGGEPRGLNFYRWIIDSQFPKDLQILCRNCNWKKHILNVQRLSRKGVGSSDPKRLAPNKHNHFVDCLLFG